MTVSDIVREANTFDVSAFKSVLSIRTQSDVDKYSKLGYSVTMTAKQFAAKFPMLPPNNVYYTGNNINPVIYWDKELCFSFFLPIFEGELLNVYNDEQKTLKELEKQIDSLKKAVETNHYGLIVCAAPDGLKFHILNSLLAKNPPSAELGEEALSLYMSTDYGFQNIKEELLLPSLEMYKEENYDSILASLDAFDDEIVVYRGEGDESTPYDQSFSWTTDINVANFFAIRLGIGKRIYTGTVKKDDVLYYSDDSEQELLIPPGKVKVISTIDLIGIKDIYSIAPKDDVLLYLTGKDSLYQTYREIIKTLYDEYSTNEDIDDKSHDALHSLRVLFLAISIGLMTGCAVDVDFMAMIALAAAAHDIGRTHNGIDDEHGKRSADILSSLEMDAPKEVLFAIKYHCIDDDIAKEALLEEFPESERDAVWTLYEILKDADALDRVRFGVRGLDMTMLRIPESKRFTQLAEEARHALKL